MGSHDTESHLKQVSRSTRGAPVNEANACQELRSLNDKNVLSVFGDLRARAVQLSLRTMLGRLEDKQRPSRSPRDISVCHHVKLDVQLTSWPPEQYSCSRYTLQHLAAVQCNSGHHTRGDKYSKAAFSGALARDGVSSQS